MSSIISFISILVAATIIAEGKYLLVEIEKSEAARVAIGEEKLMAKNLPEKINDSKVKDLFQLAELGNLCEKPLTSIHNWKECKTAQLWLQKRNPLFKSSRFVNASGDGTSLPLGCISDRVSDNHNIYWNPEGKAISADQNLRLICKTSPLMNNDSCAKEGESCREKYCCDGYLCNVQVEDFAVCRKDETPCKDYYHCKSELAGNPDACKHPETKRLCPISCGCKKCNINGCVMD